MEQREVWKKRDGFKRVLKVNKLKPFQGTQMANSYEISVLGLAI